MERVCEYCEKEHDGSYGSGRFCNRSCSNGFSTKSKRKEISKKVSKKMKGKKTERIFTDETRLKLSNAGKKGNKIRKYKIKPLSERKWSHGTRYLIFKIRGRNCETCGWNEKNPTTGLPPTQIHHKDGNKNNNCEENVIVLCPNCHSLTENYMFFGRNHASDS